VRSSINKHVHSVVPHSLFNSLTINQALNGSANFCMMLVHRHVNMPFGYVSGPSSTVQGRREMEIWGWSSTWP
jgi:hypothetical protein